MRAPVILCVFAGVVASCGASPAAPTPGSAALCVDGPASCAPDRSAVVQCEGGRWVLRQPCPGPQGCAAVNGAITCDPGAGARPSAEACAAEGGYGCSVDRRSLTICRAGRTVIASTCRGARGCVVGTAVDCDHSVAAVGDPCEGPKEIACSLDGKQFLRCNGSAYQVAEACRNACLSTGGRVLCQ